MKDCILINLDKVEMVKVDGLAIIYQLVSGQLVTNNYNDKEQMIKDYNRVKYSFKNYFESEF